MARFFTDGPEEPSNFNPFNPFAEEISLFRNAYKLGMIAVIPFLLVLRLLAVVLPIVFRTLDTVLAAGLRKMSGQKIGPSSTTPRNVGRSFVEPE